ncbi:MAG: SDR family oxidoreductase [Chloroflexi bacterium]|nr:SDR family oxidoreductase [Chloroflexota bacterium]
MSADNSKKLTLITGAAGGIGAAAVKVFVEQGWRVIATDISEAADSAKGVSYVQADLSQPAEIVRLAAEVGGGLDALVNNAALQVTKPLGETEVEEWDALMAVNLRAPWLLAKMLLEALKRSKGAVVNVASVHAVATSPGLGAYAASKGGLLAMTRSMAIEFAPEVRVNAVLPGATDTDMLSAGLAREMLAGDSAAENRKALADKVLLKRIGTPEEIARAIYFLADGEQSSYITGQPLVVDGGATARLSIE